MDADSILATGSAGGFTGVVLFLLYKLLNKRIRSKCCGQTIEIDIHTPKNIAVKVDEERPSEAQHPGASHPERPSGSSSGKDFCGTQSEGSTSSEGDSSASHIFTTENPLHISVPQPLQSGDGR